MKQKKAQNISFKKSDAKKLEDSNYLDYSLPLKSKKNRIIIGEKK